MSLLAAEFDLRWFEMHRSEGLLNCFYFVSSILRVLICRFYLDLGSFGPTVATADVPCDGTENTMPHCPQRTFLPRTRSGTLSTARHDKLGHISVIGMVRFSCV